jgi:hypothetical protein
MSIPFSEKGGDLAWISESKLTVHFLASVDIATLACRFDSRCVQGPACQLLDGVDRLRHTESVVTVIVAALEGLLDLVFGFLSDLGIRTNQP